MNTTTQVTASAISRIIKNAGVRKSEWLRGKVCGGNSEGYEVTAAGSHAVCVRYNRRTASSMAEALFIANRNEAMTKIVEALILKGYKVEVITETTWDGNKTFYTSDLKVTK
jgi:hypothetical protein